MWLVLHNFDYVTFTLLDLLVSLLKLVLAGWADKPVFEKNTNNCQGICRAVRCGMAEKWQWFWFDGDPVQDSPGLKLRFGTISVLFWCVFWRPQWCCTAVKRRCVGAHPCVVACVSVCTAVAARITDLWRNWAVPVSTIWLLVPLSQFSTAHAHKHTYTDTHSLLFSCFAQLHRHCWRFGSFDHGLKWNLNHVFSQC